MRTIEIEPDLRIRFPGQDAAFDEGVEIGLIAGRMAAGVVEFQQTVAAATLDQAGALAARFGYRINVRDGDDGRLVLWLSRRRRPAQLKLIHDRAWG